MRSPGHPVRRCAAPPFWPACCWSPGRSGPCACRTTPRPRPDRLRRSPPTARSRRSRRRAASSPRATYSFRGKIGVNRIKTLFKRIFWSEFSTIVRFGHSDSNTSLFTSQFRTAAIFVVHLAKQKTHSKAKSVTRQQFFPMRPVTVSGVLQRVLQLCLRAIFLHMSASHHCLCSDRM